MEIMKQKVGPEIKEGNWEGYCTIDILQMGGSVLVSAATAPPSAEKGVSEHKECPWREMGDLGCFC